MRGQRMQIRRRRQLLASNRRLCCHPRPSCLLLRRRSPRHQLLLPRQPTGRLRRPIWPLVPRQALHQLISAGPSALPEMVALPGGEFLMGSNDHPWEKPVHRVTIRPFAISKFPITNREWRQCVAEKACNYVPFGNDDAPVTNISWDDAKQFVGWLSKISNKDFRLPTEAEWEYAARGGTQTRFWWGDQFQSDTVYCQGCGSSYDFDATGGGR